MSSLSFILVYRSKFGQGHLGHRHRRNDGGNSDRKRALQSLHRMPQGELNPIQSLSKSFWAELKYLDTGMGGLGCGKGGRAGMGSKKLILKK